MLIILPLVTTEIFIPSMLLFQNNGENGMRRPERD